MYKRIPINRKKWIEALHKICQNRIMSLRDLAQDIGLHNNTIVNFMDLDCKVEPYPETIRTIDTYIKSNAKYLKDEE